MATFLEQELIQFVDDTSQIRGTVPVAEIFPAFQGEGALVGKPTLFLRLGGCNDRCVWCDSKYAVLPKYSSQWVRMLPDDVLRGLEAANPRIKHITLTGGNPAIHKRFTPFIDRLHEEGYTVAIETQGNVYPEWAAKVDHVTLSPKPPSSGNTTDIFCKELQQWVDDKEQTVLEMVSEDYPTTYVVTDTKTYENVCLKVVVFDEKDYAYAREVHAQFPRVPLYLQTGTPQGVEDTAEAIIRGTIWLESWLSMDSHFDLSYVRIVPQMHVLLHGTVRGV